MNPKLKTIFYTLTGLILLILIGIGFLGFGQFLADLFQDESDVIEWIMYTGFFIVLVGFTGLILYVAFIFGRNVIERTIHFWEKVK